ncbi:hypothetical protein VKT23_002900 [Stygiomarasmius scandens]|uniref:MARVEL domain-containing protein n=1 Tax=Marasmiellus scandens TaxID=2682957 RepID=A0ABR1JWD6_9AGAR
MTYMGWLRKTLYGLILALGIGQTVLSAFSAPFMTFDQLSRSFAVEFQSLSSVVAFLTWVWTSVLLSYNNKPRLSHPLTTCLPHFISFGIFSMLWIAIGIMLLSQERYLCHLSDSLDGNAPGLCGLGISTGVIGLVLGMLSGLTSYLIYSTASKTTKTHSMGFWESLKKTKLQAQDGFDIPPIAETDPDSKEMPAVMGWRIALYSLVLAFGVFLDVISPMNAGINSERRFTTIFTIISSIFSALTWIWTSILLSRLSRPQSSSILTRTSVHFYTFALLTPIWIGESPVLRLILATVLMFETAIGIMLASQTPWECDLDHDSDGLAPLWCGLIGTNIALSFAVAIFCGSTAIVLWASMNNMSGNIGQFDSVNSWYEMPKKRAQTEAQD